MKSLKMLKYKKGSNIILLGQSPLKMILMIITGTVEIIREVEQKEHEIYNEGMFIGILSFLTPIAYDFTAVALIDVEILPISMKDLEIMHSSNPAILDKMFVQTKDNFLAYLNMHTSIIFSSLTNRFYKEESIYKIAKHFDLKRQYSVAHFIYNKCIEYNETDNKKEEIENRIKELENISVIEPKDLDYGMLYKKGACLVCEHQRENHIFLIVTGKVGLYKVFENYHILQSVYSDNDIIGYLNSFENHPYRKTAVILEDSIIQQIPKEDFETKFKNHYSFMLSIIRNISLETYHTIFKINSINIYNPAARALYVMKTYLIKKDKRKTQSITLNFNIEELMDIVGLFHNKRRYAIEKISGLRYISLLERYIKVNQIDLLNRDITVFQKIIYK